MADRSRSTVLTEENRVPAGAWRRRCSALPNAELGAVPSASSTANCRGCISTAACWRRRPTRAIRCWSGCGFCRSRPTTSTNSSWSASPACKGQVREGITTREPGRADAGRATRAHRRGGLGAGAATSRSAGANCAPSWQSSGIVLVEAPDVTKQETAWLEDHFLRHDLSGADAARDRSGASVPVHSQSRLHARAAARARQRRQAR